MRKIQKSPNCRPTTCLQLIESVAACYELVISLLMCAVVSKVRSKQLNI
uniref:Uncharacterized protein n=1 Tax=Rhizophora mucronata TaxID=61149 RepID=A0A2P2J2P3_RHIMU